MGEGDALAKSRELQQWYRDTYGTDDGSAAHDEPVAVRVRPPAGVTTAKQKLEWANANSVVIGRTAEPPVTLEEIGMSPADFARLSARQRLELTNETMVRRKKLN